MALTYKRLWDYNYASGHRVFEVLKGDRVLGIVENWEGSRKWKAFTGSGFSCKFLSEHYSKNAAAAAEAIAWALV